jgi:hypothetical protein
MENAKVPDFIGAAAGIHRSIGTLLELLAPPLTLKRIAANILR